MVKYHVRYIDANPGCGIFTANPVSIAFESYPDRIAPAAGLAQRSVFRQFLQQVSSGKAGGLAN